MARFSHVVGAAALLLVAATTTSAAAVRTMGHNGKKRRALGAVGSPAALKDEPSWLWSLTPPPGSQNYLSGHQPLVVPEGPLGTPTVYQVSNLHHWGSYLNAVDIRTGILLFNVSINSHTGIYNAAAYGNNTLFFGFKDGPAAVDYATGAVKWIAQSTPPVRDTFDGEMNYRDGKLYFLGESYVRTYDANTGAQLSADEMQVPGDGNFYPQMFFQDQLIIATDPACTLGGVSLPAGGQTWDWMYPGGVDLCDGGDVSTDGFNLYQAMSQGRTPNSFDHTNISVVSISPTGVQLGNVTLIYQPKYPPGTGAFTDPAILGFIPGVSMFVGIYDSQVTPYMIFEVKITEQGGVTGEFSKIYEFRHMPPYALQWITYWSHGNAFLVTHANGTLCSYNAAPSAPMAAPTWCKAFPSHLGPQYQGQVGEAPASQTYQNYFLTSESGLQAFSLPAPPATPAPTYLTHATIKNCTGSVTCQSSTCDTQELPTNVCFKTGMTSSYQYSCSSSLSKSVFDASPDCTGTATSTAIYEKGVCYPATDGEMNSIKLLRC